jgi:hypothetical protein
MQWLPLLWSAKSPLAVALASLPRQQLFEHPPVRFPAFWRAWHLLPNLAQLVPDAFESIGDPP